MKAKIKALSPVLSGEMSAVKVQRDIAARYREGGFSVVNGRVLVNRDHDEIARAKKGELITLRKLTPGYPFEKVVMPYRIQTMQDFLNEAKKSPPDPVLFSSRKNSTDFWAFTFFGWNSLMSFADLGLLAEYLEHYQSIEGTAPEDQTEIFENFILYRTTDGWSPRHRPGFTQSPRRRKRGHDATGRSIDVTGRGSMKRSDESYQEQNARHQREWREREREKMRSDANYAAKKREAQRKRVAEYRKAKRAK